MHEVQKVIRCMVMHNLPILTTLAIYYFTPSLFSNLVN
jgi:hypothetical protein